jgi:type II secretory pathway pseudopilin PulG
MLVVISILGILAAVVTMSMVGITSTAKTNSDKAELQTVQVALDTMAADNGITAGNFPCDGTAKNDMSTFPTTGNQALYPKYLRTKTLANHSYSCDTQGEVQQH